MRIGRAALVWIRRVKVCFAIVLLLILLGGNARLYSPVSGPADHGQLTSHLRFLKGALNEGLAERMQHYFPEGHFFSHALYGLTWVELGLQARAGESVRLEALVESRAALAALDTATGRAPFPVTLVSASIRVPRPRRWSCGFCLNSIRGARPKRIVDSGRSLWCHGSGFRQFGNIRAESIKRATWTRGP